MRYISTRGAAPALAFDDVLLAGLARDGGLYVPETWPRLTDDEIREMLIERRPSADIKKAAKKSGMSFLRESAVARTLGGQTTLEEINRVTFVETS